MSPINWLILFMFFFIIYYILMNMLYFNFNKNSKLNKNFKLKTMNYNKFI
uniref:ATP synthase F0 subunit 8 n=1 Tax=Chaetosiphella stipae TaxID=805124 RepID=A0A3G1HV20_9HEMI|nr:ATP synthase F0 subunit 8 [Chaetosiphella stipae]